MDSSSSHITLYTNWHHMMTIQQRPLWRLLLSLETHVDQTLSCADCFSVLEYLAETIEHAPQRRGELLRKARTHLASCTRCQAYYEARLAELETQDS